MTSRAEWIDQARAAVQCDGDPASRATTILTALNNLRAYAQTDAEADTLRELQIAALILAGVDDIATVPAADIHRLALAWIAFDRVWEGRTVPALGVNSPAT